MFTRFKSLRRDRRGQSLVEYGILVGGIALVSLAAVAVLGHKTTGLLGASAAVLPASHDEDAGPIFAGKLVQTTQVNGAVRLSATPGSFSSNLGITGAGALVTDE